MWLVAWIIQADLCSFFILSTSLRAYAVLDAPCLIAVKSAMISFSLVSATAVLLSHGGDLWVPSSIRGSQVQSLSWVFI